jgi:hypothetical protein
MIRCFAGEVEAWITLLEKLNIFSIFPDYQDVVKSLFMQVDIYYGTILIL